MPHPRRRRSTTGLAALVVSAALAAVPLGLGASAAQAASAAQIRVDQAGFLPGEVKQAYLMTGSAVSAVSFHVVDSAGATVLSGTVGGTSRGSWNKAYPDVYPITFSGLTAPDIYHLTVSGGAKATSRPSGSRRPPRSTASSWRTASTSSRTSATDPRSSQGR
jgi:endoglucanase